VTVQHLGRRKEVRRKAEGGAGRGRRAVDGGRQAALEHYLTCTFEDH